MSVDWTQPQRAISQVMDYAWGETGPDAFIGRLVGDDSESPKAELWMGAHTKAPSKIADKGLDQWLKTTPEILGEKSLSIYSDGLPYLFKVLSAARPLSIQLHPNKEEAEELHRKDPKNYPDDNHKPEIAIALEEHEALIGFETFDVLLGAFEAYPELVELLEEEPLKAFINSTEKNEDEKKRLLKETFTSLFRVSEKDPEKLKASVKCLRNRLQNHSERTPKEDWFLNLAEEGKEDDVGLFCLFFLNYRVLQRGEGVFLKADVPHAYLKGNIIECMANSDNVVRAGLTPKFVDIQTLSRIVQVELMPLQVQRGKDNGLGGDVFRVPVLEFEVHHWQAEEHNLKVELSELSGPRTIVVLEGEVAFEGGDIFKKGEVIFLSDLCKVPMTLQASSEIYLARPGV